MITLLHAVSYAAAVAAFLFVTLSLASGLLWVAEVIEEHSKLAKVVGRRAIYAVIGLHVALLVVDRFPVWPVLFSMGCHGVYLQNFSRTWPLISLTSPSFLASCVLVLADHFVWFWHFSHLASQARVSRGTYARPSYAQTMKGEAAPGFMDVAGFFGICVWFIPLYLFLSLSANDNALPSFGGATPTSSSQAQSQPQARHSIFHALFSRLSSLPFLPSFTRRSRGDSLLAPLPPRSPLPPNHNQPGGGSYSPWGAPEGLPPSSPGGPGLYTPGGSPFASPNMNAGFQAQMMQRKASGMGMGLTPPPPPRRTASQPSSPRGGENDSPLFGNGLEKPTLGARKASNLGMGTPSRTGSALSVRGDGEGSEVLSSGRVTTLGSGEDSATGSIGRRRGEKLGGKED